MADATSRSGRHLSGIRIIPPSLFHPNLASPHSPSFSRHSAAAAAAAASANYPSPHTDLLPPLPRDMLPGELRSSPRSSERHHHRSSSTAAMSESDAREKLSDYVVFRYEKAPTGQLDDAGLPARPTWEHVNRVHITGYSRRDVARIIRDLNKRTLPTFEKKETLPELAQYQINSSHDELARAERDPRFHYVLAQIDYELRERESSDDVSGDHKRSRSSRRKSSSATRKTRRRVMERISVTAYFKRTPRPGEDVISMYRSRSRDVSAASASSAARLPPSPRTHHRHDRHHSDTSRLSPRAAADAFAPPPPPSALDRIPLIAEERRRRHSEASPARPTSLLAPTSGATAAAAAETTTTAAQAGSSRDDSPKTSRSSLCSEDAFSTLGLDTTPQSSVDGSSFAGKPQPQPQPQPRQTRFRSRSPSRERPRPQPRTRSPGRAADDDNDNYTWASNPRSSSHHASPPVHVSRSLPAADVDDRYARSTRDPRRSGEPERERERGRERRRDYYHQDDAARPRPRESGIEVAEKPKGHSHRRRGSVRFDDDVEHRMERLGLGGGGSSGAEHRVRFSDDLGAGRREKDRRKRRSADLARYQDDIFRMEDFA
jgi:hypothetical protein